MAAFNVVRFGMSHCLKNFSTKISSITKSLLDSRMTLEQFEINFMRDEDPEAEVALWSFITAAWIDYHDRHLDGANLPLDDEKLLLANLIVISIGVNDPAELRLPVDVGAKLLDCYNSLGNA